MNNFDFVGPPSSEFIPNCKHGDFFGMRNDVYLTPSLKYFGEWAEGEVAEVYKPLIQEGSVALDIGANIGIFSVVFGKLVGPKGVVHSFEPFRSMHNLMVTNTVINGLQNIRPHNAFAGESSSASERYPIYNIENWYEFRESGLKWSTNFGSVSFAAIPDSHFNTYVVDHVPTVSVDDLKLFDCNFIKIDVEGAEVNVLRGAVNTIQKFHPAVYLEFHENQDNILAFFQSIDYQCVRHMVPIYNHNNYRNGRPHDEEWSWVNENYELDIVASINALCMHVDDSEKLNVLRSSWRTKEDHCPDGCYGSPADGVYAKPRFQE